MVVVGKLLNARSLSDEKGTTMIKVNELFSGIGSQVAALKRLGVEHEVVGIAEIDKYAIMSYEAIHGKARNYGDISKVKKLCYADLWTYSFPCQDISVAGKQAGISEYTRSGLLYEVERLLKISEQNSELPKYLLLENVKNLVGKKFKAQFDEWLQTLDELGYNNYWKVLNAKNYGIPQNRERVFVVSVRKDIDTGYTFPEGFDNGLRLKDFLEDEVDEKFYISQEKTEKLISQIKKNNPDITRETGEADGIYTNQSLAFTRPPLKDLSRCIKANVHDAAVTIPCLTPDRLEKRQNGRRFKEDGEPMFTLTGQDRHGVLQVGNIVDTGNWGNPQRGRIYSADGCSPALNTCGGGGLEPKILRSERTEYGKAIRKQYESGEIQESRHNMTELQPRQDGISNTLTTVQKDNYLLEQLNFQNCPNYSSCEFALICEKSSQCVIGKNDCVLETQIEEEKPIGTLYAHNSDKFGNGFMKDSCKTLKAEKHDTAVVMVKEATKQGYAIAEEGDSINIQFPNSETRRGRVGKEVAQTLETSCNQATLTTDFRIRKLTPKESWRLMGFTDEEFQKAVDVGVSNSQLYKQAGNSIVVDVLYYIFNNLLTEEGTK